MILKKIYLYVGLKVWNFKFKIKSGCKHKFFTKFENQTNWKRCHKYIFVLIKYWVQYLFHFFYKKCSSDSVFFMVFTRTQNFLHFGWKMDRTSSSSFNVFQVLQRFLRWNFSRVWASWKLGVENERGCPLFIRGFRE